MIAICTYDEIEHELSTSFAKHMVGQGGLRMTGILFARPASPLSKAEIVNSLGYFNELTGKHIDIFCPGYGVDDHKGDLGDLEEVGWVRAGPGSARYSFSSRAFVSVAREFEARTRLRLSGGTDLVITNALFDESAQKARLDFRTTIFCQLDQMKLDKAIVNVDTFVKQIVDFASSSTGNDPTWGFSDSQGIEAGGSWLKLAILSLLPKDLGNLYLKARHFAVRDATNPSM